jgi:hypothetical protein
MRLGTFQSIGQQRRIFTEPSERWLTVRVCAHYCSTSAAVIPSEKATMANGSTHAFGGTVEGGLGVTSGSFPGGHLAKKIAWRTKAAGGLLALSFGARPKTARWAE